MDYVQIKGIPPYDGKYPLDVSTFTMGELHLIREVAKLWPTEIEEAFRKRDAGLTVALTEIALAREGHQVARQLLWDAEGGKIRYLLAQEDDESPPASAPPNEPDETENGGAKKEPSGDSSRSAGDDSPESDPSLTGPPGSDSGAT